MSKQDEYVMAMTGGKQTTEQYEATRQASHKAWLLSQKEQQAAEIAAENQKLEDAKKLMKQFINRQITQQQFSDGMKALCGKSRKWLH